MHAPAFDLKIFAFSLAFFLVACRGSMPLAKTAVVSDNSVSVSSSSLPVVASLDPADIHTYTNPGFHYTVSYPSLWKVSSYADQTPASVRLWQFDDPLDENSDNHPTLTIDSYFHTTVDDVAKRLIDTTFMNPTKILLNNQPAVYATRDSGREVDTLYLLESSDTAYVLTVSHQSADVQHSGIAIARTFTILPEVPYAKDAGKDLTVKAGEPISFSTQDLLVKKIKKDTVDVSVFFTHQLAETAKECGPKRPDGYFTKLDAAFRGSKAVRYQIIDAHYPLRTAFEIVVAPNKMHYQDQQSFGEDFFSCGAGGDFPYALSKNWLVFISACGGVAPDPCSDYEAVTKPTVAIK
ncbi:MAG: hypothetical protein JWM56_566 [Candidatus Peribacteria bacterium]|nr:hypothetical protein [Candidatus Peribacteria bacterium]